MNKVRFTDGQWAVIQPLLPPRVRTGRPRADDRKTLEGILFVLRSGCRWQDVLRRYGAVLADKSIRWVVPGDPVRCGNRIWPLPAMLPRDSTHAVSRPRAPVV